MSGLREDDPGVALLGDLPGVHHSHPVAGLGDDAEVVGDQEQRCVEVALQVGQDREDLCLDNDVERGGRLVGDHELGPQDERERDHDPLPHAAGKLVWVLAETRRRDAHAAEGLQRALLDLGVAQVTLVRLSVSRK